MKRLEGRPFALLGVNIGKHSPETLKAIVDKEKLTWRSFVDPGAIGAAWHVSGTPTLYVIDHEGVIRHKWVGNPGARVMDAAIDKLLDAVPPHEAKSPR